MPELKGIYEITVGEKNKKPLTLSAWHTIETYEQKNSPYSTLKITMPDLVSDKEIQQVSQIALNVRETAFQNGITGGRLRGSFGRPEKPGYTITLRAGYVQAGGLVQEFRGWVTAVSPSNPFVIEAKGEGLLLHETIIKKDYVGKSAKAIAEEIAKACGFTRWVISDGLSGVINDIRLTDCNAHQAIERLKDQVSGCEYFVDEHGTFFFGFRNTHKVKQDRIWKYEIDMNTLENNLEFKKSVCDGVKLVVMQGKKQHAKTVYYPPGIKETNETRIFTQRFFGMKGDLNTHAKRLFYDLNYEGFEPGSFIRGYGWPPVRVGHKVEIKDQKARTGLDGQFYCDGQKVRMTAIEKTLRGASSAAFERTVYLGERVT